jgi:hypothetical protein
LIEGQWDVKSGAIVNCGGKRDEHRLAAHIKASADQPDVAILSWHWVTMEGGEVFFWTKKPDEKNMKLATLLVAKNFLLIVFSANKIVDRPDGLDNPKEHRPDKHPLDKLGEIQCGKGKKAGDPAIDQNRQVFVITDIDGELSSAQQRFVEHFKNSKVTGQRIWLISPALITHEEIRRKVTKISQKQDG